MSDMVVVVPTRGRPRSARRLSDRFYDTTDSRMDLKFVVDADDPMLPIYHDVLPPEDVWVHPHKGRPGIVDPLNWAIIPPACVYDHVGFMGDDHLPQGDWAAKILDTLDKLGTGIVYGNDLFQGPALPTAVFMTSDIIRALGYMAPPELTHLFVDNYWLDLGNGIGRLEYIDDAIIEHLHFTLGKSEEDETYRAANNPNRLRDSVAYRKFVAECKLARDIDTVRSACSVPQA